MKAALLEPEFLVTLVCMRDLLSTTISLSRYLQSETIEVQKASEAVLDTMSILSEKRSQAEEIFSVLCTEAADLAEKQDVEFTHSRTARRGCSKTNPEPKEVEDYFRRTVFIPMLDNVLEDMKSRFPKTVLDGYALNVLLPSSITRGNASSTENATRLETMVKKYAKILEKNEAEMKTILGAEFRLWSAKWNRTKAAGGEIPTTAVESLDFCTKELYPTIRELLIILATLPSSIATPERSFCTLRKTKTWLRSTMGQERLNGLALISIHKDLSERKKFLRDFRPKTLGAKRSISCRKTVLLISIINGKFRQDQDNPLVLSADTDLSSSFLPKNTFYLNHTVRILTVRIPYLL